MWITKTVFLILKMLTLNTRHIPKPVTHQIFHWFFFTSWRWGVISNNRDQQTTSELVPWKKFWNVWLLFCISWNKTPLSNTHMKKESDGIKTIFKSFIWEMRQEESWWSPQILFLPTILRDECLCLAIMSDRLKKVISIIKNISCSFF